MLTCYSWQHVIIMGSPIAMFGVYMSNVWKMLVKLHYQYPTFCYLKFPQAFSTWAKAISTSFVLYIAFSSNVVKTFRRVTQTEYLGTHFCAW